MLTGPTETHSELVMPFQVPITIAKTLDRIRDQTYVLPAIQREFEWSTDQIARLFDSLMRGYPIGSFLFWNVEAAASREFVFYGFLREFHEIKARHLPRLDIPASRPVTAILDGQQRLTALNIGLRGSHAVRPPRWWRRSADQFPVKRLYLDLCARAAENDMGLAYDFQFLTRDQASTMTGTDHHWFEVAKVMDIEPGPGLFRYIQQSGLEGNEFAYYFLDDLHRIVHREPVINFYEEEEQDLDKVLNIFIRVNSGGTVLSYSDLLLSIATAQWSNRDAREEIHGLVDEINDTGQGFAFSKDIVLKSGLVLSDVPDVGFRVTNFNRQNMALLESNWDAVANALRLATRFLHDSGFSERTLTAASVLIPIAYYLFRRELDANYLTSVAFREDRATLRQWVIRTLLKPGIWGSGLDTLLGIQRRVLRERSSGGFAASELATEMVKGQGKSLAFTEEELEALVQLPFGNKRVFPLLSLLYPGIDVRNEFHVDHVFPRSMFTRKDLTAAGVPADQHDELRERMNALPNLQLLEGPLNSEKQAKLPAEWARARFRDSVAKDHYLAMHDLTGLPESLAGFVDFYEVRKTVMVDKARELLGREP